MPKYTCDNKDTALRQALHQFRLRRTLEKHGAALLYDLGPCLFMNDDVFGRITDCAHFDKIADGDQLRRETRWVWAAEDVKEILQIIQRFAPRTAPAPLTTSTPLQPRRRQDGAKTANDAQTASTSTPKPKRTVRCGVCKAEGHTPKLMAV
jgi:hypothetical protein